jgi:hypothetical protein
MWRRVLLVLLVLVVAAVWATGLAGYRSNTGYFSPLFSPDGRTIYALRRTASAVTLGFGYEFWTPPALVFVRQDRPALIAVSVESGAVAELARFPPSPLSGRSLRAYRNSLMGSTSAHLRWDKTLLQFEVAVTRHDQPLSRTFTLRGSWDSAIQRLVTKPEWREAPAVAGGLEPEQLSGPLEVIALPGAEGFPCAIVTAHRDTAAVRTRLATSRCDSKYRGTITRTDIASLERRAEIERAVTIERTYRELVANGVARGEAEGVAMLKASKEMERLGYFPRSPTLSATSTACASSGTPGQSAAASDGVFEISDEEFKVGLFQDIEAALARPGEEVDKSTGDYILHSRFDTSRRLNEYLASRDRTTFVVKRATTCWKMEIEQ